MLLLGFAACAASRGRNVNDVVFTQYSPLSGGAEMVQRTLPPLAVRRIVEALEAKHAALAQQSIDLSKEKFDLYIPEGPPPPGGYGLLLFISPGSAPTRPRVWRGTLDRHHLIFVSPQNAGNTTNLFDRRVPLGLLAYHNVRASYPIDDKRVYVMSYSGGGRVAEILALSYPDVFRGVVVHAGADPVDGAQGVYKPSIDRWRMFQRNRLVYISGDHDLENLALDEASRTSMRHACMLNIKSKLARGQAHDFLDAVNMDTALSAIEEPGEVDAAELARCNERLQREIAGRLAEARASIDRGDLARARTQLDAIDAQFGGLAGPEILELDARLPRPPIGHVGGHHP